jgi:hypothetical protein
MTELVRFKSEVSLEAGSADGKPVRVLISAYGGGAMDVAGFGAVVIDLAGLTLPQTLPLLTDHQSTLESVAGAGQPRVEAGRLMVEGTLASNETAQRIVALARDGVPLAASVGVSPSERVRVGSGESIQVNGQSIKAGGRGLTLVKSGALREVSILPLGADPSTEVRIAGKGKHMSTDVETPEADLVQAERARWREIQGICRPHGGLSFHDIQDQAIGEGLSVDTVRAAVLTRIRASRLACGVPYPQGDRPGSNSRDELTALGMLMGGHGQLVAKSFPDGERLANSLPRPTGWPELCAAALRADGRDVPYGRMELIKAAISTTSLPNAVASSLQKIALATFIDNSKNFMAISRVVDAVSFRPGKAVRLATASKLELVGRSGEIKHGTIGEDAFDYQVGTYARMFGVTRQDLIDDNTQILSDLPLVLGNEATRTVSDVMFNLIASNAGSYFSSSNGNNMTGTTSALSTTSLATAIATLRTRKDSDNRIIGFVPFTLLVPAALEASANSLVKSSLLMGLSSGAPLPAGNWLAELELKVTVEPRLDATSTTAWYLFSRPEHGAVLLALLGGQQGPTVETRESEPNLLGLYLRAYMDFGVNLAEYRAVVRGVGV